MRRARHVGRGPHEHDDGQGSEEDWVQQRVPVGDPNREERNERNRGVASAWVTSRDPLFRADPGRRNASARGNPDLPACRWIIVPIPGYLTFEANAGESRRLAL